MRFLALFAKLRTMVGRPAAYAAAEWNRMSARERRLISMLGSAFVGCAVLLVGVSGVRFHANHVPGQPGHA